MFQLLPWPSSFGGHLSRPATLSDELGARRRRVAWRRTGYAFNQVNSRFNRPTSSSEEITFQTPTCVCVSLCLAAV